MPIRLILFILFTSNLAFAQKDFAICVSKLRVNDLEDIQDDVKKLSIIDQKIISFWSEYMYEYPDSMRSISEMDTTHFLDYQKVFFHLCKGKEESSRVDPNRITEHFHYFSAYNISKKKANPKIHCEVLKCIINFHVNNQNNFSLTEPYLTEYDKISYDLYERLKILYFDFIFEMNIAYFRSRQPESSLNNKLVIDDTTLTSAIDRSTQSGFTELTIDFLGAKAIHADIFLNDPKTSEEYYKKALSHIPFIPNRKQGRVFLKTISNLGVLLNNVNKPRKAINLFETALVHKSLVKADSSKIYLYLAESYESLNQFESALYFCKEGHKLKDFLQSKEYDVKIVEVNEKYQIDIIKSQNIRQLIIIWLLVLTIIIAISVLILRSKNHRLKLLQKDKQIQIKSLRSELEGEFKERKRIALELHDSVASSLTSLSTHLKVLEISQTGKENSNLQKAKSILFSTTEQIRNLSYKLHPPTLLKYGFSNAVKDICEQYTNQEIHISYQFSNIPNGIDNGMGSKVFQLIQELLKNVLVHSHATEAAVHIEFDDQNCLIKVLDNGIGIIPEDLKNKKSLGLNALKERLEELGGAFTISKRVPQGTMVKLIIPAELFTN